MKASVVLTAYNHSRFTAKAIRSVLRQKVIFNCEILVDDDGSTDGAREIVKAFQKKYPEKIRSFLPSQILGFCGNKIFAEMLQPVVGEYITIPDGDDHWNSPHKLQCQVDCLDHHAECAMCFHNVMTLYENGGRAYRKEGGNPNQSEISTLEQLLIVNFMKSCSVMLKGVYLNSFPIGFILCKPLIMFFTF